MEVVFDPVWDRSMMSEAAKLQLGHVVGDSPVCYLLRILRMASSRTKGSGAVSRLTLTSPLTLA